MHSAISRHWRHCSNAEDFIEDDHLCFQRLMNLGCDPTWLKPAFEEGAKKIERKSQAPNASEK